MAHGARSIRAPAFHDDRFELGERLGEGAVGVVHEAFDRELGQHVALKLLRAIEPELLASLKAEFRAARDLRHPNLVQLGELFEHAGQWFFTMELVRGESFQTHVANETEVRPALLQLARGLGALHAAQLVHRDVKPSNVLVERGRVVLLDFGLATRVVGTRSGVDEGMRGTVAYMAPEQISDEGSGREADWYAFGVILFQVLTERLPFTGSAHEIVEQKLTSEAPRVHEVAPHAARDLAELCDALLCSDPARRAGEREVLEVLAPRGISGGPTSQPDVQEPFVGRTRELAQLERALADVARGSAVSLVVHGESGVGKSCLVHTFCERAVAREPATLVLHGRCHERESVPYKAVDGAVDDLRRFLRELSPQEVSTWLPDDLPLLASLFPVLGDLVEGTRAEEAPVARGLELRRRAFAALRVLVTRIAETRPVVLIIDDLQWADADSLALLKDVLCPPAAPGLLLIATRRPLPHESSAAQVATNLPGDVRELHLAQLSDVEAAALASGLFGEHARDDGAAAAIARESGGHPLFIAELVRQRLTRKSTEPLRLDDALWARVEALPAASRALLAQVCVAGHPLPHEVSALAAGVELGAFLSLVAELRRANLLRTSGVRRRDLVEPFHDRVRETVVTRLDAERPRELHARLAAAYERAAPDDFDALTTHCRGAGDDTRAAHYAVRAGDRAARALAFDRAAHFYQLARELSGRPDAEQTELLAKLAQALTDGGRGAESAELCLIMAASAQGAAALELRRSAAEQFMCSGHHERGLALLRELCATSGIYLPRSPFMVVLAVLFVRLLLKLRGVAFRARRQEEIDPTRLAKVELLRTAALGLTMTDHLRGAYFKALNTLHALAAGEPRRVLYALAIEAAVQSSGGRRARPYAQKLRQAAEALASRTRVAEAPAWLALARGYEAFFNHDQRRARAEFVRGEAAFQAQVGEKFHLASLRALQYRALIAAGELRELSERVMPALRDVETRGDVYAAVSFRTTATSFLALAADDVAGARAELARAEPHMARDTFLVQHYFAFLSELRIRLYAGQGRAAYELACDNWPHMRRALLLHIELVRVMALEHRARAALAAALEDESVRAARLEEAERLARDLLRERVAAVEPIATMLLGAVADARGRVDEALSLLGRAEEGLAREGYGLHLSAVRRRRGALLGGAEGAALVAAADGWLASQDVRAPARFCAMFYPAVPR